MPNPNRSKRRLTTHSQIAICVRTGDTCLHLAASNGNQKMLDLLIDRGANLRAKNCNGQSALIYAARQGHLDQVVWLYEKAGRTGLTEHDKSGRNILHEAAATGHLNVLTWACGALEPSETGSEVRNMKEYRKLINLKDRWGKAPVHLAAYYQRYQILEYLVDKCQANVFTKDKLRGLRPATTALQSPVKGGLIPPLREAGVSRRSNASSRRSHQSRGSRSKTSVEEESPAWVMETLSDFERRTSSGKADQKAAMLETLKPKIYHCDSPVAEGPICGEYLRNVYGRDGNVDTTEGLKVSISPGVVLRNTAPSLAKQLFALAIKTELEEAVEAKNAWNAAVGRLERAKAKGEFKLAGELEAQVLHLKQEYDREQMEADNAVKQIQFTMQGQAGRPNACAGQ